MKISQIGEDAFIQSIKERMNKNLPKEVVGIEDDSAVMPYSKDKLLLISTDSLVEGCHFLREKILAEDLGYKAVMVNASDIAAMGGKGLYVLMSVALPNDIEESWLDGYLKGVAEACAEAGLYLIGGDTTGSKEAIFINFTIVGEVDKENIKYRKDAQEGDVICLSAPIGDSLAGFHDLMEGKKGSLARKHSRPKAAFKEGEWLGKQKAVHSMMDLSDGVYVDLARMMEASGLGAEVLMKQIPMSKYFIEFSQSRGWNAAEQAVVSGEEYCLLLTVDSSKFEELNDAFIKEFSYPLNEIGKVKVGSGVEYVENGKVIQIKSKSYFHFNEK